MCMTIMDKPSFQILERSLDAASLRQKVIANNIANVDTPFFKRSEVKFEDLLRDRMNGASTITGIRTNPRHFYIGAAVQAAPQVVQDNSSVMNNNMNNVDIDTEMASMAKNQLNYNVLVQQVNNDFQMMRTAIDARG